MSIFGEDLKSGLQLTTEAGFREVVV